MSAMSSGKSNDLTTQRLIASGFRSVPRVFSAVIGSGLIARLFTLSFISLISTFINDPA